MTMHTHPKTFIVIPAFNEASIIAHTISALTKSGYNNIIVVNDCSSDATAHEAMRAGAEVISHVINRGYGAALRTGIDYVRDHTDADIVVTFDADGQHQPKDIAQFIDALSTGRYDIALGSRFLGSAKNIPLTRKIVLRCAIIFTTFTSGMHLTDAHNGFRALNRKAMERIHTRERGMEYASEIIDEIHRKKLRATEVPVEILYTDYATTKGQPTGNFVKLGIKIILKKYFS